jgi:type VI protein secretion system component VasF
MTKSASLDPRLSEQYRLIEAPLLFFVDSMIAESSLPFAEEWNRNRMAFERNELAGDEKFFDLLDQTLADPSEQATERLAVFFTCLGLGFTGWYAGNKDYIQRKAMEISARLPPLIGVDAPARLWPDPYAHLDASNLIEPPGKKMLGIGIALAGLCIVLFLTNLYLYRWTSEDLVRHLKQIVSRQPAPEQLR